MIQRSSKPKRQPRRRGRDQLGEGKTKREIEVLAAPRPKVQSRVLAPPVEMSRRNGDRPKDGKRWESLR